MSETNDRSTGPAKKTAKDAGWEVGVREVVGAPASAVWTYLTGEGLKVWLGDIDAVPTTKKAPYATRDGVRGIVLGYTENARIRVSWKPDDWPHDTELLLTIKETDAGSTIAISHENLADREERRQMLGHWKNVIAAIAADLREW